MKVLFDSPTNMTVLCLNIKIQFLENQTVCLINFIKSESNLPANLIIQIISNIDNSTFIMKFHQIILLITNFIMKQFPKIKKKSYLYIINIFFSEKMKLNNNCYFQ